MDMTGFIGTGNMGYPLLLGAIKAFGKDMVTYSTPFLEEMKSVEKKTGVPYSKNNCELINKCRYIVICVKPQFINDVYNDLKQYDLSDKVIISIVAGISIARLREGIGQKTRIVRVMPNTPAMVGEGMACICFSDDEEAQYNNLKLNEDDKQMAITLLSSVGKVEIIPEKLMTAAICANGSSPAYVYMFIEALADSVVKYGIPRTMAYKLAAQTVCGAAKMVLETGEHPGRLKDNVCSPGGTTICAVEKLEEYGFRNAVMKATDACYEKGLELGNR